jgi:hypothetical protein
MPQRLAELPISFERKFQLWKYGISHSELKLRSIGSPAYADVIEATFYGVVAMKLATVYEPLTIDFAMPGQIQEMARLASLQGSQSSRVKVLALKSTGDEGLIACLSFTVWSRHRDLNHDSSAVPKADGVLILKG